MTVNFQQVNNPFTLGQVSGTANLGVSVGDIEELYELLKNNLPPVVIAKDDRVKYFEFLKNNDNMGLAKWLKELSAKEKERIDRFGYKR